jgi:tetratricopeptide (TPR) repeat protein
MSEVARGMMKFVRIGVHWCVLAAVLLCAVATASPLDDQLKPFKTAPEKQSESALINTLKTALAEHRSAEAFAVVRPWLARQQPKTQNGLYYAGISAEYSGDLSAATDFYKALLNSTKPDPKIAGAVVVSLYRVLINDLAEPEMAYAYMRAEGNRLHRFGRAKKFDRWFIDEAKERNDLPAVCDRVATIYKSLAANVVPKTDDIAWICDKLETFDGKKISDEDCQSALRLAAISRVPAEYRARLGWAGTVILYNHQLDKLREAKVKKIDPRLTDKPFAAAARLLQGNPDKVAFLVADGWRGAYSHEDRRRWQQRFGVEGEKKLAQLLTAIPRMSPKKRNALLAHPVAHGPVKFNPISVRKLANQFPDMLNTLTAADVPLFDKSMTLTEAKALAPKLARNPHAHAALVRAYAVAGAKKVSAMVAVMVKSERWRFGKTGTALALVWNSGAERDGDHREFAKQYNKPDLRHDQLKKQVSKTAKSRDRIAAFKALHKELLSPNPSTLGLLGLWDELFANAPDPDRVKMLTMLTANLQGDQVYLVRRAGNKCAFGGQGYARLPLGPEFSESWARWGRNSTQRALPELAAHLQGMLGKQMQAGRLSEPMFGMWLYSVNPRSREATAMMKALVASRAYAKVDSAYQALAARREFFGDKALLPGSTPTDPRHASRELLDLQKDATPAQVAAALKTVVTRATQAPAPVVVYGLNKVAALPTLTEPTRKLVLSLFSDQSPLGPYPSGQGYGKLVSRLVRDMRESKQWGSIVPYASAFWRAVEADGPSPRRTTSGALTEASNPYAEELVSFAAAALEAGAPSVSILLSRDGVRIGLRGVVSNVTQTPRRQRLARLRSVAGKASLAIGVAEITVDKTDPHYGLYKSNSQFVQGNEETAWKLYKQDADKLQAVLRKLSVDYGFWLLKRTLNAQMSEQAEGLIKGLTIWSRDAPGVFSSRQSAELKVAYADLAFQKGLLPTARIGYRRVADVREYKGAPVYVQAVLGIAKVDRTAKNFSGALTALDKLLVIRDANVRMRAHYARAMVFFEQENFMDAVGEIDAVLRNDPGHEDALLLRGEIQIRMRKLVDATEVPIGPRLENKMLVPGETVRINLLDPTLSISGLGANIEVEISAGSGDRVRVMLHQMGDDRQKFGAEVPTALAAPVLNDKVLQVLGRDTIKYGYSKRFRAKMKKLPPDPNISIGIASDARLDTTSGTFRPKEGQRELDVDALGLSAEQKALAMSRVRPGNPIYIRVIDPDQSRTSVVDEITVFAASSSGDSVARVTLKETGTHTGEFTGALPTAGAQATATASESAPGREANMAISAKPYPGWSGKTGSQAERVIFAVDLNDDVAMKKMTVDCGTEAGMLRSFVLQTSMNGRDWVNRARYPNNPAPWDGRQRISFFRTSGKRNRNIEISIPRGASLPRDWAEKMRLESARLGSRYGAGYVPNLATIKLALVAQGCNPNNPNADPILMQYRAMFYQPAVAVRRFRLTGFSPTDADDKVQTIFVIDGRPGLSDTPMTIERRFGPGLHEIQIWRCEVPAALMKHKPLLQCSAPGKTKLTPCPDSMFDPAKFPPEARKLIQMPATIMKSETGSALDVAFGTNTRARIVRMVIFNEKGIVPEIKRISMTDRDDKARLPVALDYQELRDNGQLEVLPGDRVTVRYQDDNVATKGRNRHESSLSVAYHNAKIKVASLKYTMVAQERVQEMEPVRRFDFGDSVAVVINDADMDISDKTDTVEFTVQTPNGGTITSKALETEAHSGEFVGRIFPVEGKPERGSEIQVAEGAAITATYRDMENLNPGIPTDRSVTVEHAKYVTPEMGVYNASSEPLDPPAEEAEDDKDARRREIIRPRHTLKYKHVAQAKLKTTALQSVIGAYLRFEVIAPHLALARSSRINAYVQTGDGRKQFKQPSTAPYNLRVPGTLKLQATPSNLNTGRFSFSVPLVLGDLPGRSFAADLHNIDDSLIPRRLAMKAGDTVHIGYPFKDSQGKVQWYTADVKVVASPGFLDVMNGRYNRSLTKAYVGENIFLRVVAPGLDRGPGLDAATVSLKGSRGVAATLRLVETKPHSGIFKGLFALAYADKKPPAKLPPVELNGFPVRYGETVTVSYQNKGGPADTRSLTVNMGANGSAELFTKRFEQGETAVKTHFTLAECYFELAKQHKKMAEESLARREMAHAQKLLAEALDSYRDDELQAHAEYLLGNLAQEYADLAKNQQSKMELYRNALARFSKIPLDYPETEFAPKAQFKTALVYEKMGEIEISVEEYVKLAYKYPDGEYIPEVISRLGGYFQKKGQILKDRAIALKDKEDDDSKSRAVKLMTGAKAEFLKAARVFARLELRFPEHALAGLAGVRVAQNYMRAERYQDAIKQFQRVADNKKYDAGSIRARALYWGGISYEKWAAQIGNPRHIPQAIKLYRRATFDFPDSRWAKQARGRLADATFEDIMKKEEEARKRALKALEIPRKRTTNRE